MYCTVLYHVAAAETAVCGNHIEHRLCAIVYAAMSNRSVEVVKAEDVLEVEHALGALHESVGHVAVEDGAEHFVIPSFAPRALHGETARCSCCRGSGHGCVAVASDLLADITRWRCEAHSNMHVSWYSVQGHRGVAGHTHRRRVRSVHQATAQRMITAISKIA